LVTTDTTVAAADRRRLTVTDLTEVPLDVVEEAAELLGC
jgi:hypothetical protein